MSLEKTLERKEYGQDETPVTVWRRVKDWKGVIREEDGMGTVEIILIIVVLVGLVLIFKEEITSIVENLFDKITKQTNKI